LQCFYHSADLDGHCSGALIKMVHLDCKMIGIDYGDVFPWDTIKQDEPVFMVDFSLQPFEDMEKLNKTSCLTWIDHHKSAIESAHTRGFLANAQALEVGKGACQLVYEFLHPNKPIPTFVKLLAEYDVWDHSDPRTLAFQYGMRQQKDTSPENIEFWMGLFDTERVMRITEDGGIILDYQNTENGKYAFACAFETELDGLKCIAMNKMLTNSKVFDSVWDKEQYQAMLLFGFRKGSWTVSLYSDREDVDVSAIAKARGGGGHKGAAGFQCDELPFSLK